ncbi:2OG-Fe(II) oxygenase [Streptomyces sp. RGM 3693]|uniref:2OG-Fe(II) oxygenase n=1 Tax=Streptomyces sp. RGM 3693 TaxID=3413284 RepID=UPI003D2A4229
MLNLRAPARVHDEPYRWAEVQGLITPDGLRQIRAEYPPTAVLPRSCRDSGGDKTYRMSVVPLVRRGEPLPALAGLGAAWRRLVGALDGGGYRTWVRSLLDLDVRDCAFDIGLFAFGPGDRISPHTDKPGKCATHVFYLNERWDTASGGQFEVRTDGAAGTPPLATVSPGNGRSVLFVRSHRSWHSVAPVADDAHEFRLTFQVEMWR